MTFRFNFDSDELSANENDGEEQMESLKVCKQHRSKGRPSSNDAKQVKVIAIGGVQLCYINPEIVELKVESAGNFSFLHTSDLQSGEYEGGLKVWECTFDLLSYLENNKTMMADKKVLDLGCGAGLLGLYTYLSKADTICMQDYNSEVIKNFTIPSTECTFNKNHRDQSDLKKFEFLSGDWDSVSQFLSENNHPQFDLMLSSETIYNIKYYSKLLNILQIHLTDDGLALFAAKTHYFGVGGGIFDFTEFVHKNSKFDVSVVHKIEGGLSRQILKVTKRKL